MAVALKVKAPLKVLGSTVPVIVPDHWATWTAHVPFTPVPDCVRLSVIATCARLLDSRVPVQVPATCAGRGIVVVVVVVARFGVLHPRE